jgi:serine/threonine-protein kinase RsbW
MFCVNIDPIHLSMAPPPSTKSRVRRECVQSPQAIAEVIERLCSELLQAGYDDRDLFATRMSLEEAIVNAVKHGHEGDATRPVWVNFYLDEDRVVFQVEDQGQGFDPTDVPDPCDPENLERSSGRGLLLMRSFMSKVCHNERGNCVCFCKPAPVTA